MSSSTLPSVRQAPIRAEARLERARELLQIDRRIACLFGKFAQPIGTQPLGVELLRYGMAR